MREHVPDVCHLPVEMNRGNEPILVAADVEHVQTGDPIDAAENCFEVGEMRKRIRFDASSPDLKRHCCVWVKRPEVNEALVGYHTHEAEIISI